MAYRKYEDVEYLSGYYFEDSFVLAVNCFPGRVEILADIVLTPNHPKYKPAKKGEVHCYVSGRITFHNIERGGVVKLTPVRIVDADNSFDMGNIDIFIIDGSRYKLAGDWGEIDINAEKCVIEV